tara:strand:+ start:275 stop:667 length:393 start_codon:yes stop_codon:yes gene_type:complete
MLIIQCNCTKCRKLSGSYQIGCLYSVEEIHEKGDTSSYEFEDGSGFINTVHFCIHCHVRCKTHPAAEIMEGMVGIPLGIFDTAKNLSPKAEIWTSEKLPFLKTDDCVSESFEDSGIAERLTALLENLDNR